MASPSFTTCISILNLHRLCPWQRSLVTLLPSSDRRKGGFGSQSNRHPTLCRDGVQLRYIYPACNVFTTQPRAPWRTNREFRLPFRLFLSTHDLLRVHRLAVASGLRYLQSSCPPSTGGPVHPTSSGATGLGHLMMPSLASEVQCSTLKMPCCPPGDCSS